MYRQARVHVYDLFGEIHIAARVWAQDSKTGEIGEPEHFTLTCKGIGNDTDGKWLRDALMEFVETL